ncbi:tRNA A37 methylthiotransferase MiaB [Kitasatospora sp. MAP12-15]|uniref:radical SAM protein n=1 Tax=unclassified Kitasatospora TaxID=2633591 RepID=UPI002472F188|nr:radical SAM protein [Kitasatospora sp. MAP12-44]MDH6108766.1 tRNA A37 methylthiotransferase MiaB [Kitasatospora sp. MAP12-44]
MTAAIGTPSPRAAAARTRQVHLVDLTAIAGANYSPTLGYLQAAAQADPEVAAGCTFVRHALLSRGPAFEQVCEQVLAALDDPLVVAFTVYFWNRAKSVELARRVKQAWPGCHIVMGGNDVSYQQDALFAEAPWTDVLVHGDGEFRFVELLRSLLRGRDGLDGRDDRDGLDGLDGLASIDGLSYWAGAGAHRRLVTTKAADRIADLSAVPSPISVYSDAELAATSLLVYETNRGCPYGCAFCYWGGATNSKVRQFPMERIEADLDRIIRLAGPHMMLALADANFGILPRDVDIARMLVDTCERYGKRVDFFVTWAKNCNKRIVQMAGLLRDGGLLAPVTLSAQSFSADALELANRSNIRVDNFRKLQAEFRDLGIPTYTDLIWGMPGETYDSFLTGTEEVLTAGGAPIIFPLLLLNNTDYTREKFRQDQKVVVRHLPVDVSDPELTGDTVVSHATMTEQEWLRGLEFRFCLYLFQKSLLRCTLRLLHASGGVRMVDLCELLRDFLFEREHDPVAGAIARNYRDSWSQPDRMDRELIEGELNIAVGSGELYGRQETHYEAILHRLVRDPDTLARFLDEAVAVLLRSLPEECRPQGESLRAARELDLAAGAVFRAMATGVAEPLDFRLPADLMRLLRDAGDLPPELDCPQDGEITGRISAAPVFLQDFHPSYSFSRFVVLVWRGLVSPLREAAVDWTVGRVSTPSCLVADLGGRT